MVSSSKRRIRSISYAKYGYLFILPFFLVYAFFQLYPLFNTFFLSTQSNGTVDTVSVGLDNFKAILFTNADYRPWKAIHASFLRVMGNTILLWIGNFIPQIFLSLLLAAWFTDSNLKIKGKGFFKVVMYMPNIITAASVAALFVTMFSETEFGAVNRLLLNWHIIDQSINFVTGATQSRVMIMFIQTWMWFGNTMIMLMSGIMGISPSLFEAANIDGANSLQVFFRITLPLLRPIMLYTLVTSMIGGLQMYDMPALYNVGTTQNQFTETIAVFIFGHFHAQTPNYGYSGAASVLLFFITAILGIICFYFNRDKDAKKYKRSRSSSLKNKLGGI